MKNGDILIENFLKIHDQDVNCGLFFTTNIHFHQISIIVKVRTPAIHSCVLQTILLGDSGVGKTSLLVQFDTGRFQPGNFAATVGIGFTVSNTAPRYLIKAFQLETVECNEDSSILFCKVNFNFYLHLISISNFF